MLPPRRAPTAASPRPAGRTGAATGQVRADQAWPPRLLDALPLWAATSCARRSPSSRAWSRACRRERRRPARRLGRHPAPRQAQASTTPSAANGCRLREHMSIVLRRLQAAATSVPGPVRHQPRRAGAGGDLHRHARTLARKPAGSHAGGGVCPDLRPAGYVELMVPLAAGAAASAGLLNRTGDPDPVQGVDTAATASPAATGHADRVERAVRRAGCDRVACGDGSCGHR